MFMVSFRLKKGRVLAGIALVGVVALAVASGSAFFGGQAVATGADGGERPARVRNNEQRLEYISTFGWQVEPEPVEIMEVIIPTVFDPLYEEYNTLQLELGYDLNAHAGRRARRYTYVVVNHPVQENDVRLNLLVRDNRVIGGDVYSGVDDGFMHSLEMPG